MTDSKNYLDELKLASFKGDLKSVKNILTYSRFSPFEKNNNGEMAFHSALIVFLDQLNNPDIKKQKIAIFRLFIQQLKDLYQKNRHQAVEFFMCQDVSGNNFMHYIAAYNFYQLFEELLNDISWIKKALVGNDGLIFQPNNFLHYPIHAAILNNQQEIIERLLSLPNVALLTDARGQTPLHYAAKFATKNIVEICCNVFKDIEERESYINCLDGDDKTPLMLATEVNNIKAIEVLLECGARNTINRPPSL